MQEMKPQSPKSQIIEEQQNETDDFSFASLNPNASPISAEDAFLNGQIRTVFHVPPTPELGKIKSHSTGFSNLWRFAGDKLDKIRRSSSDGDGAFLFMRNDDSSSDKKAATTKKKKRVKETASYHLYGKNRAENEKTKRKSYLPYRSTLMGFFSAPNGFTTHF